MNDQEWRPILGWEGRYEASSGGVIRSLPRLNGRGYRIGGKVLKSQLTNGYKRVDLCMSGKRRGFGVHQLVMLAFVGPRPDGQEVLHGDGNRINNHLSNLSYGTRSENVRDSIRHGTNVNASKTHCKRGHEFSLTNTLTRGQGCVVPRRNCRACAAESDRRYRARKKDSRYDD